MASTGRTKRDAWILLARTLIVGASALLSFVAAARGQDLAAEDLRARVERLERENAELRGGRAMSPAAGPQIPGQFTDAAAPQIVDDRLKDLDAQRREEEAHRKKAADQSGYEVGRDPGVQASFKDGLFLWLESPDKDFTMHLGAWMQWDNVWWNQSQALKALPRARPGNAQGVATGVAGGGIGELQDGEFFRRIRPFAEGTFWGNGEYRLIPALENNQFSTAGLDEFWVGATDIPAIGTVRVGHVKDPMGLEGDMTASSRCMTFLERSAYSEAIELNQNFVTGVWFSNNYLDRHVTCQAALFRPDQAASTGAFFGDGQSGVQFRFTGLPLYAEEGRDLLHLGFSGGWRDGTANIASLAYPGRTIQLRARPELRDDVPAGSPTGNAQLVPNANSSRMVDAGVVASRNEFLIGLEALYIRGPFSIQAEYGWNWINNAVGVVQSASASGFLPLASPQDYVFDGGYLQLAYTLTGESRAYDQRGGTLAREYFGKQGPSANAWAARDAEGNLVWGLGAWEIAARYSHVDLNSGFGLNRIQGGAMNGVTLGLNWYLNTNLSAMFDWVYNTRYDLPPGTVPGHTSGFGARVQFQF